jgi:hypothetical protein
MSSLFSSELACHLARLGFLYPEAALWALKQMGLPVDLAWYVMLQGDVIPVSLSVFVRNNLSQPRRGCARTTTRAPWAGCLAPSPPSSWRGRSLRARSRRRTGQRRRGG